MKKLSILILIAIAAVSCQKPDPIASQYEAELEQVFPDYNFTKMEFVSALTKYDDEVRINEFHKSQVADGERRVEKYKRKVKYTPSAGKGPWQKLLLETMDKNIELQEKYNARVDSIEAIKKDLQTDTISKQYIHHFTNDKTAMGIVVTVDKQDQLVKKGNPMELTELLKIKAMGDNLMEALGK